MLVLRGREGARIDAPDGVEIRLVDADDDEFAAAHAVATVGFGAAGTHVGVEGSAERDQAAAAMKPTTLDFMRERALQWLEHLVRRLRRDRTDRGRHSSTR